MGKDWKSGNIDFSWLGGRLRQGFIIGASR
jgi:hypothetical protein